MRLHRRAFLSGVAGLASACVPAAQRPYVPILDAAQDTAEVARGIVSGRTGALFYVDRLRGRPGADRITSFGRWDDLAGAIGFDGLRDVHRAFACAATSGATDSLLVLEHGLGEQELRSMVSRVAKTKRVEGDVLHARIQIDDTPVAVVLPREGLIVLAPTWCSNVDELRHTGGLPNPRGSEVARFFAFRPQDSLGSTPEWPDTISAAQAEITFDEEGGANVLFQATSTTPAQAAIDAATMERTLDDLLHIPLGPIRMPIFDPIHFHADGDTVRMEAHLLASDVDWILGFRPP